MCSISHWHNPCQIPVSDSFWGGKGIVIMPSLPCYHFGPPLLDSFHPVSSFTPCSHSPHVLIQPMFSPLLLFRSSFISRSPLFPPSFFILNSVIPLSLSLNLNIFSPRSPPSLLLLIAYCLHPTPKASDLDCSVIFS